MCLSSQQEVAARQLTWWRQLLCNGEGGSNDDNNAEALDSRWLPINKEIQQSIDSWRKWLGGC